MATSTFTVRVPANPYLRCDRCGARVEFWRSAQVRNEPCGHDSGATSMCPSWGPVNGCECEEHLGNVPHPLPDPPATRHGIGQGPL